jgi:uncharacterized protein YdaT
MPDEEKTPDIARLVGAAFDADQKLAEQQKSELDELPRTHPLRIAIEQAKERYETEQQVAAEGKRDAEVRQLRKAKKAKEQAKKEKQQREADRQKRVASAEEKVDELNESIDAVALSVRRLAKLMDDAMPVMKDFPVMRVKATRLGRLLVAVHRGLEESKFSKQRLHRKY